VENLARTRQKFTSRKRDSDRSLNTDPWNVCSIRWRSTVTEQASSWRGSFGEWFAVEESGVAGESVLVREKKVSAETRVDKSEN
jgi:hypothetical protein